MTAPTDFEPTPVEPFDPPTEEANESRFGHFVKSNNVDEPVEGTEDTYTPSSEGDDEGESYSESPSFEAAVEPNVEGDTEAFLEKVFSQLEVNGKVDVEEEGHGLLRRRRMGSVLKDIDEG